MQRKPMMTCYSQYVFSSQWTYEELVAEYMLD